MIDSIGIIDYGMGNLHSVQQAFKRLNRNIQIIKSPDGIDICKALILPGVGAFDPAMENLKKTQLIPHLKEWVHKGKPLLGICLGLQLLFESSDEGRKNGLGFFKGHVHKLPTNQNERVPHMGWGLLSKHKSCPLLNNNVENNWMYFVHSYSAIPLDDSDIAATTTFGKGNLTAIVWKGNIGACQFHPEKSAKAGERMLSSWLNWLELNPRNKS